MKKLLSFLTFTLFFVFAGSVLYVFNLPPFQNKDNLLPSSEQKTNQNNSENVENTKVNRPKSYDEYMKRGKLLEENKYSSLAIHEFEEAQKIAPTDPEPTVEIGRIHLRNNEFEKAEIQFQKAVELDQNDADIKVYLGRSLLGQRKIEEAKQIFEPINVENQSVKYYQGIIAAFFGEEEKAKKLLDESIKIGTAKDITDKAENFLEAYDEFLSYQAGSKLHQKTLLARSFNQTGEYQMAIAILFDVIKEQKNYRDAWIILGHSYLNIQKYQDALEALSQAKKIDSTNPEVFFYLGLAYHGLNDLSQAAFSLEQAKKFKYQPIVQIDQKLAEIYLELKEFEKSASAYERVVTLHDAEISYYIRPVWLNIEKLNKPEKALEIAGHGLKKHPSEAMSYNLLAWAQMANKDYKQAESNLQIALKIDPDLDAVYLNYGRLEQAKNNSKQALSYYEKAYTIGQGNSISQTAADLYNKLLAEIKNSNNPNFKVDVLNP